MIGVVDKTCLGKDESLEEVEETKEQQEHTQIANQEGSIN